MLETLANLAEILAGLAIVVSLIRFWPTFNEMRSRRPNWNPRAKSDLDPFVEGLSKNKSFTCPTLSTLLDVRDAILAALHLAADPSGSLRILAEQTDRGRRGILRFYVFGRRITVCDFESYLLPPLVDAFRLLADTGEGKAGIEIELNGRTLPASMSIDATLDGPYLTLGFTLREAYTLPLDSFMLPERVMVSLSAALSQSTGIVLASGPMGSGRTVVMASCVHRLSQNNIDIVGERIPGVTIAGMTHLPAESLTGPGPRRGFKGLLMEVSDEERVRTALEFADHTGVVVAGLFCEDAASGLILLHQLDPDRLWSGESGRFIMNQRLVGTLCDNCKTPYEPDSSEWERVNEILELNGVSRETFESSLSLQDKLQFFAPKGCDRCLRGYSSRLLIIEALAPVPEMKEILMANPQSPRQAIRSLAIENGTRTLSYHWLEWAALGATDFANLPTVMPYGEV